MPPLCGDCCTPSCGGHLKDKRNGYKRDGSKRGKNSREKRKRESQSWQLVRDLHADLLQIPGMEEGLKNRQLTTRQLMRKVLRYYSNSLAKRDSVDPLAEFPADVREFCRDLTDSWLGSRSLQAIDDLERDVDKIMDVCTDAGEFPRTVDLDLPSASLVEEAPRPKAEASAPRLEAAALAPRSEAEAPAASTMFVPTLPSSEVESFLVPQKANGDPCSHYNRKFPKMWKPGWGKKREADFWDLVNRCTSESRDDARRDPEELLDEFWSDFLETRTAGLFDRAAGQFLKAMPWEFLTACIRSVTGSNLYAFCFSLHLGLQAGPATKSDLEGVYMYETDNLKKALSSSGYRVYSSFGHKAYFWSVVYECAFGKFLTHTLGKMSAGNGQMAAKDGSFHVVALWFHCLHVSEMHDCVNSYLTVNADFFDPDYEIRH